MSSVQLFTGSWFGDHLTNLAIAAAGIVGSLAINKNIVKEPFKKLNTHLDSADTASLYSLAFTVILMIKSLCQKSLFSRAFNIYLVASIFTFAPLNAGYGRYIMGVVLVLLSVNHAFLGFGESQSALPDWIPKPEYTLPIADMVANMGLAYATVMCSAGIVADGDFVKDEIVYGFYLLPAFLYGKTFLIARYANDNSSLVISEGLFLLSALIGHFTGGAAAIALVLHLGAYFGWSYISGVGFIQNWILPTDMRMTTPTISPVPNTTSDAGKTDAGKTDSHTELNKTPADSNAPATGTDGGAKQGDSSSGMMVSCSLALGASLFALLF